MALTVTSRGTGTDGTGATTLVPGGRSATLAVNSLGVLCMAVDNAGSAGNTLIAPDTWTDAKSNLWTLRANALFDNGAASAGIEMAIYTAPIVTQLLTTDAGTMTWKTGVSPVAKAWTWYEVIPSNGIAPGFLDKVTIAGATAANATVGTGVNLNVGDAVIGGYFSENTAAVTGDSDSTNGSWTAQQTATVGTTTAGVRVASQQKVQTTTASTQSYDVTVSSQDRIAGLIMVREVIAQTPQPTAAALATSLGTPTVAVTSAVVSLPTTADLTATASTPTVTTTVNVFSEPTVAAMTLTGTTSTVATPVASLPSAASVVATPATPTVATTDNMSANPSATALSLVGETPAVLAPRVSEPIEASLSLTPDTPSVRLPVASRILAASLSLIGATPSIGTADNIDARPDAGALIATGAVPSVSMGLLPGVGSLLLSGGTPDVIAGASWAILPSPRLLEFHGARPDVTVGRRQSAAGWQPPDIRLPHPITVRPRAGSVAIITAVPVVTIIDDGDILDLLAAIA